MTNCEWYAKKFSAGDMTGEGSQKILGRPAVHPVELMVRETTQNSWDARLAQRAPGYRVDYRRLSDAQRRVIIERVLTAAAPGVDYRSLLEINPWVFEIVDWNTKGLGGPTRADQQPPAGQPTDFIDFVLKMGAQRDTELGGGSYGFGKTASYVMSRCDTILIWTRCRVLGKVQDRFIASALGNEFSIGKSAYTGRQWWGRVEDDRPEPIVGEAAKALGEATFRHRYGGSQTGTAIMVLAADHPHDADWTPDAVGRQLRDAILWNLWPKMVPDATGRPTMDLQAVLDGEPLDIPDPREHPVLQGFSTALTAVRETQAGRNHNEINTEVVEIRQQRPKRLTGHMAIHRWPSLGDHAVEEGRPGFPTASVALMRHEAELLVRFIDHPPLPGAWQWAGVFKPVSDCDDAFTDAEPPSHDDWVPANVEDKTHRSIVKVSLREINKDVPKAILNPASTTAAPVGTAQLATALADLAAPMGFGPSANKPSSRTTGKRSGRQPKVSIGRVVRGDAQGGRVQFAVELLAEVATIARLDVKVSIDGGSEEPEPGTVILRSMSGNEIEPEIDIPSTGTWVTIDTESALAIEAKAVAVVNP
ncbi:hypothetical protein B0O41_0311 [Propionibacteriaceae bacterium ES.041]|uniref:hypothetical protein n=1 Tax=Enemella evansiae TaxID=2016499 RepID=UPI000B96E713|nr:hypothetical protein [Enemella evansiae]OYO06749.1 hypothetical protein CGZ95_00215 [Enemella evansiae]PFG65546.1 hypothetical protein B0O41_0311 [Propionibacteriaceae bacterium ES.041]